MNIALVSTELLNLVQGTDVFKARQLLLISFVKKIQSNEWSKELNIIVRQFMLLHTYALRQVLKQIVDTTANEIVIMGLEKCKDNEDGNIIKVFMNYSRDSHYYYKVDVHY